MSNYDSGSTGPGRMPAPVIEVSAVRQTFGAVDALRGVSLEVGRGETYALLGTNGAGKTTLMEIIEGHRAPDAGTVRIDGRDPGDRRTLRKHVGIMLQEGGLALDLSVKDCLRLLGSVSGREDSVPRLLERVGLSRHAKARVGALSGGERRRLDFAAAIWGGPRVLFLDEPTTGLDPTARLELWSIVDELRSEGSTVLLTTHYLEEAERHADRIALMHLGKIEREGTLAELVSTRPSTISFTSPVAINHLPLHATPTRAGQVVIESWEVQRDLATLVTWADGSGLRLNDLASKSSNLEDVFKSLTGSALSDAHDSAREDL